MAQKLFILIRSDLSVAQQGVQAGHAVALAAHYHREVDWTRQHFVYLTVLNLERLELYLRKANHRLLDCHVFEEPGVGKTALAVLYDGHLFDALPLWDPVPELKQKISEIETALHEAYMGEDL